MFSLVQSLSCFVCFHCSFKVLISFLCKKERQGFVWSTYTEHSVVKDPGKLVKQKRPILMLDLSLYNFLKEKPKFTNRSGDVRMKVRSFSSFFDLGKMYSFDVNLLYLACYIWACMPRSLLINYNNATILMFYVQNCVNYKDRLWEIR